jgi:hypothetical protein
MGSEEGGLDEFVFGPPADAETPLDGLDEFVFGPPADAETPLDLV